MVACEFSKLEVPIRVRYSAQTRRRSYDLETNSFSKRLETNLEVIFDSFTNSTSICNYLRSNKITEGTMSKVLIEIRDYEGGDDAKLLAEDMFRVYARKALRNGL